MASTSTELSGRVERAVDALRAARPDLAPDGVQEDVGVVSGGITNHNFRISIGGRRFFLRLTGEGTAALGIDRDVEFRCHALAAERGLAPPLLLRLPGAEGFFTEWIEGLTATAESLATPEMLRRLGRLLRRCHDGPAFPPAPGPFEAICGYRSGLGDAMGLPPGARTLFQELEGLELTVRRLEGALIPPPRMAPCHNDLVPGNAIDDGERLWLVDWEYARQGDPFMDLGTVAANLKLDDAGSRALLEAWDGRVEESALARLRLMAAVSDLRDAWWCVRQAGLSTLETDYPALGRAYLESLRARLANPRFEQAVARLGRV